MSRFGFGLGFLGHQGLVLGWCFSDVMVWLRGWGLWDVMVWFWGWRFSDVFPFPAHLIIRACAHGEKYSCLARLGGALYMYYASVSSLHRESTYSLVYTLNGVLLFGERERANLVVRLARFFYIYVYICLYICIVGRVHIVRMRMLGYYVKRLRDICTLLPIAAVYRVR